jgi:hypothetical protein
MKNLQWNRKGMFGEFLFFCLDFQEVHVEVQPNQMSQHEKRNGVRKRLKIWNSNWKSVMVQERFKVGRNSYHSDDFLKDLFEKMIWKFKITISHLVLKFINNKKPCLFYLNSFLENRVRSIPILNTTINQKTTHKSLFSFFCPSLSSTEPERIFEKNDYIYIFCLDWCCERMWKWN